MGNNFSLTEDTPVITASELQDIAGVMVHSLHKEARKASCPGLLVAAVPGHGGDVWFVKHKDEEHLAAYLVTELSAYDAREQDLAEALAKTDAVPEYQMENYQYFLGRIADAAGVTGSPTLEEVLQRVEMMRNYAIKHGWA